jgi:hypothetical protein
MNSDSFVLCPRCRAKQILVPLNQREEDGKIICGFCHAEWPGLEVFLKELDETAKKNGG